jgi:hypothetical protein
MVDAMVTGITSSLNQSVSINVCSLAEVEVNVKILSNLCAIELPRNCVAFFL